jgi:uncharacterized protein YprB with RNaseH-like and TPR domain
VLEHTFLHLRGVGPRLERHLWDSDVRTWNDARARAADVLTPARAATILPGLDESADRLEAGDPVYFQNGLPSSESWRLFHDFRHTVAYLDIETTGLGGPTDIITTIALYDGGSLRTFVHGDDLDEFPDAVARYGLLVTYNGKCFDVPFINHYFGLRLSQAHIDLRYVLARLGYKGGLKGCERAFGIDRGELDGVDGFFAVRLWRDYIRHGNDKALETLLAYNAEDVVNLETLMILAYNLNVGNTPFAADRQLPLPDDKPPIPFQPHTPTIHRLRGLDDVGW